MAESKAHKKTNFVVETDEIPIPIEDESIGDTSKTSSSLKKSTAGEDGPDLDDVFHGPSTNKRKETQAFIVSRLPSHRSLIPHVDVPRRRSLSRGHTFHGTLQKSSSPDSTDLLSPLSVSASYYATLPAHRASASAKETLFKITKDLCTKDEVDFITSADVGPGDSSHARLLKAQEKRKSILDAVDSHTKSVAFRTRLKSVTVPIAEKKALCEDQVAEKTRLSFRIEELYD